MEYNDNNTKENSNFDDNELMNRISKVLEDERNEIKVIQYDLPSYRQFINNPNYYDTNYFNESLNNKNINLGKSAPLPLNKFSIKEEKNIKINQNNSVMNNKYNFKLKQKNCNEINYGDENPYKNF